MRGWPSYGRGSDEEALGPSDLTGSGSDTVGADRLPTADPSEPVDVTLGRDRVIEVPEGEAPPALDTGGRRAGPGQCRGGRPGPLRYAPNLYIQVEFP